MTPVSDHDERSTAPLLTARQVARMLAISERTVWRLSSTRTIPQPVRIGGATRWRLAEVRAFLDGLGSRAEG